MKMRNQLVFGLVAALCVLGVSSNEETPAAETVDTAEVKAKICEPGALSEVACNTCICNNAGTEMACTKKICVGTEKEGEVVPQNLPVPDSDLEVKPQNLPVPDSDLEVKPQNLPVPEADLAKPQESEIPAVAKDRRRRRRRDADDVCEPGKNFEKECNSCECPASGKKSEAQICTTIAC